MGFKELWPRLRTATEMDSPHETSKRCASGAFSDGVAPNEENFNWFASKPPSIFPNVSSAGQCCRCVDSIPAAIVPFIHWPAKASSGEEDATTTLELLSSLTPYSSRPRNSQKNRHQGNQTQSTANRD